MKNVYLSLGGRFSHRFIGLLSLFIVLSFAAVLLYCVASNSKSAFISIYEAEEHEFAYFIQEYNKNYRKEEYEERFKKFRDNLGFIRVMNKKNLGHVLGINEFADIDDEEFNSIYLKEMNAETDEIEYLEYSGNVLPNAVDWVAAGKVTPVKNQGACGSCYSFSATGVMEGVWAIAHNELLSFSEQQILDCSNSTGNAGCNGGYSYWALQYVLSNGGIANETTYPYRAAGGPCNSILAKNIAAKFSNAFIFYTYNSLAMMEAVSVQPISVSVDATMWRLYKGGIMTQGCGTSLNHAVLITGYNITEPISYWVVKNSWGTSWGMHGYVEIGMQPGLGVCGINTRIVYPIV